MIFCVGKVGNFQLCSITIFIYIFLKQCLVYSLLLPTEKEIKIMTWNNINLILSYILYATIFFIFFIGMLLYLF